MKSFWIFWGVFSFSGACAAQTAAPPAGTGISSPPAQTVPVTESKPAAEQPAAPAQKPATEVEISLDSPTQVIQKYTEELKSIVDPTHTDKGKRDTEKERKIADKVRQFFDFDGLAQMALGRHWNTVTPAQRNEYKELFISLIEDSYLRKSRDLVGDYKIKYVGEEIKGNRAKVTSRVIRNDADVDIIYQLRKNPKNWMIFNIVLDNVDLVRNYQTQFNRIIEQSSFNGLLSKMKKKKDELDKETTL